MTTPTQAASGAGTSATSTASTPAAPDLAASLGQMAFGLAVVIVLLFASLWLLRRLSAPRGNGAALKVLGAAAVGPRERVVLVEVGDEVLVLGVAPGQVTKLHELSRDELAAAQGSAATSADAAHPRGFASWLKQAVEHRQGRSE
jgi:flagellar protein FliO/FliZ